MPQGWFRCWTPSGASSVFDEPPYAEPHVRWCERATGATPSPTRYINRHSRITNYFRYIYNADAQEFGIHAKSNWDTAQQRGDLTLALRR
ncbi:hypothetical protein SAMN05444172_9363 [Burkholderia sp. GAS332]|nr:hypothetical protein SAMN05444172_9363 [Burkholderia sp. GAS332]